MALSDIMKSSTDVLCPSPMYVYGPSGQCLSFPILYWRKYENVQESLDCQPLTTKVCTRALSVSNMIIGGKYVNTDLHKCGQASVA